MLNKFFHNANFYKMKDEGLTRLLKKIGTTVKEYRDQKNLSQFDLGLEIGLSANQIGRIERSESNPTIKTLYNLAIFFEIDIQEFFDDKVFEE